MSNTKHSSINFFNINQISKIGLRGNTYEKINFVVPNFAGVGVGWPGMGAGVGMYTCPVNSLIFMVGIGVGGLVIPGDGGMVVCVQNWAKQHGSRGSVFKEHPSGILGSSGAHLQCQNDVYSLHVELILIKEVIMN